MDKNIKNIKNIIVEGWFDIPHSYSLILAFQIYYISKNYKDKIKLYKRSKKYYFDHWKINNIMPQHISECIKNIPTLELLETNDYIDPSTNKLVEIDLIYSVSCRYSIETYNIKKLVFYTSEFKNLTPEYFEGPKHLNTILDIERYSTKNNNLYFTGPSKWSTSAFNIPDFKNVVIPHGVDENIFYRPKYSRNELRTLGRKALKIFDTDLVFLNLGSMTSNKNISMIITAIITLILNGNKHYKLILKGTNDLYASEAILKTIKNELVKQLEDALNITNKEIIISECFNNIIFIYDTLDYTNIRSLYTISDVYIGPYLAEGFSLTHLEALFCSLSIIVPRTGSTEEYIDDLYTNGGLSDLIFYVPSEITSIHEGNMLKYYNNISIVNLINLIKDNESKFKENSDREFNMKYLHDNYSWSNVTDKVVSYFDKIMNL